jgi:hypothetical protein
MFIVKLNSTMQAEPTYTTHEYFILRTPLYPLGFIKNLVILPHFIHQTQFKTILNSIAMPYKQADQEICSIKKETPGKE